MFGALYTGQEDYAGVVQQYPDVVQDGGGWFRRDAVALPPRATGPALPTLSPVSPLKNTLPALRNRLPSLKPRNGL